MNFLKYNLIGILNTLMHWSIYLILTLHFNYHSEYSNFISFLISASLSYILNSKMNYKTKINKRSYFKFMLIIGFISIFIAKLFLYLGINNLIMLISYTILNVFLGYFFTKKMVFKK